MSPFVPARLFFTVVWLLLMNLAQAEPAVFEREYAPLTGLVSVMEKPERQEICLNGLWQFQPLDLPKDWTATTGTPPELTPADPAKWDAVPIRVPSPWNANAVFGGTHSEYGGDFRFFPSYPKSWEKAQMGWLQRAFTVPAEWAGRRIVLHFEAVAGESQIIVNGRKVFQQFDSFLPFSVDVTDVVKLGEENHLLVGVRGQKLFNTNGKTGSEPYPAGSFWSWDVAGIWQDIFLLGLPEIHTEDVFLQPNVSSGKLLADVELQNDSRQSQEVEISWKIVPWKASGDTNILTGPENRGSYLDKPVLQGKRVQKTIPARGKTLVALSEAITDQLKLWSPEEPNLYGALVEIYQGGKRIDSKITRFGWREFRFDGRKFLLNGKPILLRIEICHFMGIPHLTPRWTWAWYRVLKEQNINAVRLHALPHPRFFLEIADEQGMLIHDESAIYASHAQLDYDSPLLPPRMEDHVKRMVSRDRNHASVFGWSVENEVFAALRARLAPFSVQDQAHYPPVVGAMMNRLMTVTRELDPTREWISGDGDGDLWPTDPKKLPVLSLHYGDLERNIPASKLGPPWGVTEATNAYFGGPGLYEAIGGEQVYESFQGRMRAVALDVYKNITEFQLPFQPVVVTAYDATWYGMKPLPLGMKESSRLPTPEDGIRMPAFVEGKPGVQPERIGPYSMVINPGFDPVLPLFDPWPQVAAMKAAFDPRGPQPFTLEPQPAATGKLPEARIKTVSFVGDPQGALAKILAAAGVTLKFDGEPSKLQIVDASEAVPKKERLAANIQKIQSGGGTVIFWGVNEKTIAALNSILPKSLELTSRTSTSLIRDRANPVTAGVTAADLFFMENHEGKVIMENGLDGPFVQSGAILLQAPKIDWRRWYVGISEMIRPVSVVRNEAETQPPGACMVSLPHDAGTIVVTTLVPLADNARMTSAIGKLLSGFGVELQGNGQALSAGALHGWLPEALQVGPFRSNTFQEALAKDFLGSNPDPKAGTSVAVSMNWTRVRADERGFFVLPSKGENETSYLAFTVMNPLSRELLLNPFGTEITLKIAADDAFELQLNGKSILKTDAVQSSEDVNQKTVTVSLEQGTNVFLLKVSNASGITEARVQLHASRPEVAKAIALSSP